MTPNQITFIGLCNEFCTAIMRAPETEPALFVAEMTRLLPRLYISAADLPADIEPDLTIDDAMDEDHYDSIRRSLEIVLGENDTYLEVFEEDMKYSDTPIGASIAEGLADLTQVFFNIIETVREAPTEVIPEMLVAAKNDFETYWSQKLVNVMRPLNQIRYNNLP